LKEIIEIEGIMIKSDNAANSQQNEGHQNEEYRTSFVRV
jgi:hypothetical protein